MIEDGFAQAILADPVNDTTRLVFADWLEERNDPRAGCLRLAVRLRERYGPRNPDHSNTFWERIGHGIEPAWWGAEARRLADEVNDRVGDGCKSAVLIALALTEATLLIPDCGGIDELRRDAATAIGVIERLALQARSDQELERCARTAAAGEEAISQALADAFGRAGKDGIIRIERTTSRGPLTATDVRVQQGLRLPAVPVVMSRPDLTGVAVLVSLRPLGEADIDSVLAGHLPASRNLLCLCPDIERGGLERLRAAAHGGGRLMVCTSTANHWEDRFEDAAMATGANILERPEGDSAERRTARLGQAVSASFEGGQLAIQPELGDDSRLREWCRQLYRRLCDEASLQTDEAREWLSFRLAQLMGGVVTVEIARRSQAELEESFDRADGAIHACRAMIAEGYVPGGGGAYFRAANAQRSRLSRRTAWALEAPIRSLLAQTGLKAEDTLTRLRRDRKLVLDVARERLVAWADTGPIDSLRVVRATIQCAIESAQRSEAAGFSGQ
jgi:chaperonin GroEL